MIGGGELNISEERIEPLLSEEQTIAILNLATAFLNNAESLSIEQQRYWSCALVPAIKEIFTFHVSEDGEGRDGR